VQELVEEQAAAVGDLHQHAVAWRRGVVEQAQDLLGAEHGRQRLGPFAIGDERQLLRPAQRGNGPMKR
jgi:hypothetical protein